VLSYLAAILGRWDDSERLFSRALATVIAVGRRSLAARMRFELGDLWVRLGHEPDRARELIAAGRSEASALGLNELVELIDRRHPGLHTQSEPSAAPVRARSAAPSSAFTITLEGEYYAVVATNGTLRFKASRGMRYLALLVERPNTDVHVLELVGSSEHADRGDAGELIDADALHAYRARLQSLREALEHADGMGDAHGAESARSEMEAIARELARSTQKGGRVRRAESAIDRARSAVQRRIKDAIDRIAEQDGALGSWLRRAVRTGNYCSYRPDA
jgi:hypothetical protein